MLANENIELNISMRNSEKKEGRINECATSKVLIEIEAVREMRVAGQVKEAWTVGRVTGKGGKNKLDM